MIATAVHSSSSSGRMWLLITIEVASIGRFFERIGAELDAEGQVERHRQPFPDKAGQPGGLTKLDLAHRRLGQPDSAAELRLRPVPADACHTHFGTRQLHSAG